MRRAMYWIVVAAAGAACESPNEPRAGEAPARTFDVVASPAIVARAAGAAHRDAAGLPVILNFSATKFADGSVRGEYYFRALGTNPDQWLRVKVTCMTVVDGNKAWIAGVTVDAFLPALIGRVSYFYTFDNGEGAASDADIVSLVRANDVPGEDERFCTLLPTLLPQREVLHGNVHVEG